MPEVIPRQIIEAINVMFGQPLNELEHVQRYKQAEVRTLQGLLEQLPNTLITLPFHKYLEFERARAELATVLKMGCRRSGNWAGCRRKKPCCAASSFARRML
jgi:hypothetical protein